MRYVLTVLALAACGDDAGGGAAPADTVVDGDVVDSADGDALDSADGDAVDSADAGADGDVVEVADAGADGDVVEVADAGADGDVVEVADAGADGDVVEVADSDVAGDDGETANPIDPATCPVPPMTAAFPPPLPPFPYGTWPAADACLARRHDVIIVLGCPSEDDGRPSSCQIGRAIITQQLYLAGLGDHFIVTGGAVHNAWNEADALYALLVERSLPADAIIKEPLAEHTDENLYYATRIMEDQGWTSALVVSEDPGHLMMTAVCDANCCVERGRLSLFEWEVEPGLMVKAGHYALTPPAAAVSDGECLQITGQLMCFNIGSRKACKDNFQLGE